ncbi:MAG: hypothetical protein QNJ36_01835 [Calothrix sp. MO_167.B42]|nr:hypothetical protein [Calothrix sp. MO_167.B42]
MSYIVTELETDVFMELNHKQTEQICGGSEVSFEFSDEQIEEMNRQVTAVFEKYKDDDCKIIWYDSTKSDEPWSVDHYICYREGDELPDYLSYNSFSYGV